MYDLEELKAQVYNTDFNDETIKVINWLISEVETLRLDNTYLQQRLKREVEK